MKVAFICPFELNQLTGTPIRAKTTINAAEKFSDVKTFSDSDKEGVFIFTKKSLALLRNFSPTIVHGFTSVSVLPMFLYKILFSPKTKIVFEMHGWSWYETEGILSLPKRFALLILDIFGYYFSSSLILMSYSQKDFLFKRFFSRKNVDVLWGPVDFDISFEKIHSKNVLRVGYLGNSSFWQGISYIVEAAKILKDRKDICFILAGFDSSDKEKCPDLSNIEYAGRVARENVPAFIKGCDIMLSPRIKGKVSDLQYPHKLSEYLSSGRGVIVSHVSDQKMIIDESGAGIVIEKVDGESLSKVIVDIRSKGVSGLTMYGEKAAQFAKNNFGFIVFEKKLKSLYDSIS